MSLAPLADALGPWLCMKPKKRQPLDFSATPTDAPPEETKTTPELPPEVPGATSFAGPEADVPTAEPLSLQDTLNDDLAVPPPMTVRSRRRREPDPEPVETESAGGCGRATGARSPMDLAGIVTTLGLAALVGLWRASRRGRGDGE